MVQIKRSKGDNMLRGIFRTMSLIALLMLLYLSQVNFAFKIECYECTTGNCICKTNCQNGFVNIYHTKCQGMPIYEISVTGGLINWQPKTQGTYYWKILCDNGEKSICETMNVLYSAKSETPKERDKIEISSDELVIYLAIFAFILIFSLLVYNSTKSIAENKKIKKK